jgi:hypothetical protein
VNDQDKGLSLDWRPMGRNGKVALTARLPDGSSYTDKADLTDPDGRKELLGRLCKGRKGIDKKAVAAELERIASDLVGKADEQLEEKACVRPSQADRLVGLAGAAELFHTPGGHDSEGFATVKVGEHRETWPVNGKGFRRWLAKRFYDEFDKAPSSQAMQDALAVIAGQAVHDGPEHAVAVRVAECDGAIYLDLADELWRAVRVTAEGWSVVTDPPVKFTRRRGMLALPLPERQGSIVQLRPLVNLADHDSWILFVAWLLAAMRPGRPFPVLAVNGEQGSAKSTLCRMGRCLIDPNVAALRRPPRDERDLMIAAANGWVVALDNLSGLAPFLSDALCTLATGGGFATRELFTDGDEKLFDATRPIMLNGIEDVATRPDLLDRALCLTLAEIDEDDRRDEHELWRVFMTARPRILGALLDAVAVGLRNLPVTRLASKPRMADFALWVVAAETALPWKSGDFLPAYGRNRNTANDAALDASILVVPVLSLLSNGSPWVGTARELLDSLEATHTDEKTRKRKEWPTSPRKLSGDLRRLAPNLRRVGVAVTFDHREPGGKRRRLLRIERDCNPPSQPSQPSRDSEQTEADAGASRYGPGPNGASDRPAGDAGKPTDRDGRDGRDGTYPGQSDCSGDEEEMMEWTG